MGFHIFGGPGDINNAVFDPYSLVHALVGVAMGALGFGLLPTLVLAVGWEVAEHALKNLIPAVFPHASQDTLLNSAGDVLASTIGWMLTRARMARRARRM